MRYKYNVPFLYDSLSEDEFKVNIPSENEGLALMELLNFLEGKVNYQEKVIDKCLANERKYKTMIEDKDYTIKVLVKEKNVLKKIIIDEGVNIK